MNSISAALEGVRLPPPPRQAQLDRRDLGVDFLGTWIGGCLRAGWYKANGKSESDPAKERLLRAQRLDLEVRAIYMDYIRKAVKVTQEDLSWTVADKMRLRLDAVVEDQLGLHGILICVGGGISFRSEVFGTKYQKASAKPQDAIQAALMLTVCPVVLDTIELLYVDRGMMDDITHVVSKQGGLGSASVRACLEAVLGPNLPACSYQKDWTDPEAVAKLYADKMITKSSYETFKSTGAGGDWQCSYCPYRQQCYNDDRSFR